MLAESDNLNFFLIFFLDLLLFRDTIFLNYIISRINFGMYIVYDKL